MLSLSHPVCFALVRDGGELVSETGLSTRGAYRRALRQVDLIVPTQASPADSAPADSTPAVLPVRVCAADPVGTRAGSALDLRLRAVQGAFRASWMSKSAGNVGAAHQRGRVPVAVVHAVAGCAVARLRPVSFVRAVEGTERSRIEAEALLDSLAVVPEQRSAGGREPSRS